MIGGSRLKRVLLGALVFCMSFCMSFAVPAGGAELRPSLYVYVHTDTKSAALEKMLQERMSSVTVTVFGRFRDFEEAMAARRPDAVVAFTPLLVSQNVSIAMQ